MQNRQTLERLCLFGLGGAGYCGVELAWRGFTHWTMFLAGGLALCLLAALDARPRLPLPAAAALGALGVTGIELAAGLYCRLVLHAAVWDYSAFRGNVAGLVCPRFCVLWLALCAWVLLTMRLCRRAAARLRAYSPSYRTGLFEN